MGSLLRAVAASIWIYSYATLGFMMAIAALPAYFLAQWGWGLDVAPESGTHWWLDPLMGLYFSILAFFTFGIALMVVIPATRWFFRIITFGTAKPHIGAIPTHSFAIFPWYNENGMMFMFNTVFGRFARLISIYPVFLRLMGAKIGRDAVVNTHHIYDLDILSIGEKSIIGANASILGHVGERGKLLRQPVRIGAHCTVGQFANIFPGVVMGDNCHVGAMSLVPKGSVLDANAVYGGVPVRKIKDLAPGQRATADDVSGTAGVPADAET